MRRGIGLKVVWIAAVFLATSALGAEPAPLALDAAARMFGARPAVIQMSLAPDGKHIAYIGPAQGQSNVLFVGNLASGEIKPVTYTNNKPVNMRSCDWSAVDRLVCQSYGLDVVFAKRVSLTRLFAIDADGANVKTLAVPVRNNAVRISQFDGVVVDWLDRKGQVLIARDHVPTESTGTIIAQAANGFGVDRVDTRTNSGHAVERARLNADHFLSDGRGHIRIIGTHRLDSGGVQLSGERTYQYRSREDGPWLPFSTVDALDRGTRPIGIDDNLNAAYVLKARNGRDALYRIALDGSMKEELVLENDKVDIAGITYFSNGHIIGAYYQADRQVDVYFDAAYQKLAQQIARALPKTPQIDFIDASTDEDILLIRASSDTDEGRFYIYQKSTHAFNALMPVRPQTEGRTLANIRSITYKSFDGIEVPAYLTLPPGSTGKNLPTIVMPHGGPQSRDVWGFDFLAQFFASRGFAVIQPEFRGSAGFGEAWFLDNGFKSWRTAIGDVNAAGRWLIAQGVADPAKLAIFGWSYGGYAALQANVLDPDLFKAAVAVAPVTDLGILRREQEGFTNENIAKAFIGGGPLLQEASPARHADVFKAPVLLFHGTNDINVSIAESVAMDGALHRAGKKSELVRYPDIDHPLGDSAVRTDLLTRADTFLRQAMHM